MSGEDEADLKRKVRKLKERNEILGIAIQRSRHSVKRLKLEYAVLLERLEARVELDPSLRVENPLPTLATFKKNLMAGPVRRAKTRRQRAKERDPNMPKRPTNAYLIYCEMNKEKIRQNGSLDVTRDLTEGWKNLDEEGKLPYYKLYNEDRERYQQEMEMYNKGVELETPSKDEGSNSDNNDEEEEEGEGDEEEEEGEEDGENVENEINNSNSENDDDIADGGDEDADTKEETYNKSAEEEQEEEEEDGEGDEQEPKVIAEDTGSNDNVGGEEGNIAEDTGEEIVEEKGEDEGENDDDSVEQVEHEVDDVGEENEENQGGGTSNDLRANVESLQSDVNESLVEKKSE